MSSDRARNLQPGRDGVLFEGVAGDVGVHIVPLMFERARLHTFHPPDGHPYTYDDSW